MIIIMDMLVLVTSPTDTHEYCYEKNKDFFGSACMATAFRPGRNDALL